MPKVSVIVPCYNVEQYLERCLKSLLEQTLKDIEIILVDDGSPDKVPHICDDYANIYSNIKVIHKENAGLGFARNSGLKVATGEYVGFVDSDDYIGKDMFSCLFEVAKHSNADVVFSNFYIETAKGHWANSNEVLERNEWNGAEVHDFMLDMVACAPGVKQERKYQMSVWHSIYRRSIIEQNNIRFHSEREVLSEDFPFQMDFLKNAYKVIYIPQAFYHYCLNNTSLTKTFSPAKFERVDNLYDLMCHQLAGIESAQTRLDRFYIGYVRARISDMISSNCQDKKDWIEQLMNGEKLKRVLATYSITTLPFYQRIVCYLLKNKFPTSLMVFISIVNNFKRLKAYLH